MALRLSTNLCKYWVNQYTTLVEGGIISSVHTPKTPSGLVLYPPVPNPFHDSVDCRFELPEAATLVVEVTDLQGKTLRRLATRKFDAGSYTLHWDGTLANSTAMPASQYVLVFH